tara:strand:- start:3791 stop:4387 length:597 start_codon:yes stop_codon:yes gene_type:complete
MINKLFFLILGLSSLSCVEKKEVETGIVVEDSAEEDTSPIHWDEIECSYNIGDHICNLTLVTAMNTVDELHNYHGKPLVLEVTSMRCSDCQRSSANNQYLTTMSGDMRWITIIMENEAGMNPSVSDGRRWSNAFTLPYFYVWLGGRAHIDLHHGKTGFPYSSYPYYVLIDDDLVIYSVIEGYDKDKIINNITDMKSSL